MTGFRDEDDDVVLAAYGVLTGDRAEGTMAIRRVDPDGRTAFVYRIDPDADRGSVEAATPEGEFPDAEAVRWRADRDRVEQELERRNLDGG